MSCPHCQSDEISESGVCLVCGHQVTPHNSAATAEPSSKEELPQWRKELSQRLQEIRQKKDAVAAEGKQAESKPISTPVAQNRAAERPDSGTMRLVDKPPVRKPAQVPRKPPPRQKPLELVTPESSASKAAPKATGKDEVEAIIDKAVSQQSTTMRIPVPIREIPGAETGQFKKGEGKLIFLSRTLSGLIDLICIIFFVGIFIIAADRFGGIIVLDAISLAGFAALFLLTYFVYSVFFLTASSQTIGMMITDLRVIGINRNRPSLPQFLVRCFWHLISLFVFGLGLLWGLLDRKNQCLHDRLSDTRVIRS